MHRKESIEKRTWYGLKATIIDGPGFLHTAGFGFFLIPHPPAVNWLLRRGLSENNRLALVRAHEFQHFQSAPFILIYAFLLFTLAFAFNGLTVPGVIISLVSCQALWEISAEMLTRIRNPQFYRDAYAGVSGAMRALFWIGMCLFTIAGWMVVPGP